jgi:hypothetical protein
MNEHDCRLYSCKFENDNGTTQMILVAAHSNTNVRTKAPEVLDGLIERGLVPAEGTWKLIDADPLFAYVPTISAGFSVHIPAVAATTGR